MFGCEISSWVVTCCYIPRSRNSPRRCGPSHAPRFLEWKMRTGRSKFSAENLEDGRMEDNWVCLKIGYIPNYSHLIGIMISKTIGFRGTLFSDKPNCVGWLTYREWKTIAGWWFQRCFMFHFIYGIILPSHWRTHIFEDGWNHQPGAGWLTNCVGWLPFGKHTKSYWKWPFIDSWFTH